MPAAPAQQPSPCTQLRVEQKVQHQLCYFWDFLPVMKIAEGFICLFAASGAYPWSPEPSLWWVLQRVKLRCLSRTTLHEDLPVWWDVLQQLPFPDTRGSSGLHVHAIQSCQSQCAHQSTYDFFISFRATNLPFATRCSRFKDSSPKIEMLSVFYLSWCWWSAEVFESK